jgi:hypothetical protein
MGRDMAGTCETGGFLVCNKMQVFIKVCHFLLKSVLIRWKFLDKSSAITNILLCLISKIAHYN